jgi:hypothetical protein
MGLGKTHSLTLKSSKNLSESYEICKRVCESRGLKAKSSSLGDVDFSVVASEPMKWITTNYPNSISVRGEIFGDAVMLSLFAESKGVSITQDKNISDFLSQFSESLKAYLS